MNRFNRLGDKLSDKIKFPTSFDMEGKLLQLIAYGVHFGNSTGLNVNDQVHYKSYVKGVNETWTEIDDGVIKSLSEEDELSIRGSAYFCLYSFVDIGKAQTKQ
jgi:ubiquitin C-terminal hydrolase